MSIYGAGDTHTPRHIHKLNAKNFPQQREMTKQDFVIIMGDFGLLWENIMDKTELYWMKWLNDRNFTTLFIDGNHENHHKLMSGAITPDIINTRYAYIEYPEIEKNNDVVYPVNENYQIIYHLGLGGYVGRVSNSIFHLRRGEIYTIQGKKFFVMGGAESVDKVYFDYKGRMKHRIEGKDIWSEEVPNRREFYYGLDNLDKHGRSVDYILAHTAPEFIVNKYLYDNSWGKCDPVTRYLDRVVEITQFERFFCGHFHIDEVFDDKYHFLFNKIVRII